MTHVWPLAAIYMKLSHHDNWGEVKFTLLLNNMLKIANIYTVLAIIIGHHIGWKVKSHCCKI